MILDIRISKTRSIIVEQNIVSYASFYKVLELIKLINKQEKLMKILTINAINKEKDININTGLVIEFSIYETLINSDDIVNGLKKFVMQSTSKE